MKKRQSGVVLLAMMLFIFMTTLGVGSMVQSFAFQKQRDAEDQLLFVGDQYRRAIISYYNSYPTGSTRHYPTSLADLATDTRFPSAKQHLRSIYPDPMTGEANWELIRLGEGIIGVRSRSTKEAIKKSGFPLTYEQFEGAKTYRDWRFMAKL